MYVHPLARLQKRSSLIARLPTLQLDDYPAPYRPNRIPAVKDAASIPDSLPYVRYSLTAHWSRTCRASQPLFVAHFSTNYRDATGMWIFGLTRQTRAHKYVRVFKPRGFQLRERGKRKGLAVPGLEYRIGTSGKANVPPTTGQRFHIPTSSPLLAALSIFIELSRSLVLITIANVVPCCHTAIVTLPLSSNFISNPRVIPGGKSNVTAS
ncbi:hypothetical protein LX36DRAFT_671117 [Colletotrichum falcatum]|nr:hypothetical protein LX36DRAFT_671117 [Colletotrichum falcatum]